MTTEPQKEPKSLLDCFVFEPDPKRERREKLKQLRVEVKEVKAQIRQYKNKNTAQGLIWHASKDAHNLKNNFQSFKGPRTRRVLKRHFKETNKLSKEYLPKLEKLKLDELDYLQVEKRDAQLFIMKMRYDALESYNEKILAEVKNWR